MPGSVAISHHEPGLVAFQSVKPVARYRAIREDVLAGNDYRCPSYIRPTVGCVNVGRGLEDKITVAGGPVEDCDSPELLKGQRWPPQFNGPDVAGVAAAGIDDGGEVEWPRRAALVCDGTEIFALVDGGAAGAQCASARRSAVIRQRSQERV